LRVPAPRLAKPPRRILVIAVARIGDTLLITPALRALAQQWPEADITFLGHPKRVEVMRHLPFVAKIGPISKNRAPWLGWLGGKPWDLALVYGFDRPLVTYALRVAREVVAFRQDHSALDARLSVCVEPPAFQSDHAVPMRLALTRALGVPDAGLRLTYTVTAEEDAAAKAYLARRRLEGAQPLVGLQVRAFPTKAWRDWPIAHFAELCQRMIERWPGAHFVLFGGSEDRARTEELVALLPGRATSLAGELGLRQAAAVMKHLGLFIGLDSGPTHIVGALGPPMIGLYHCLTPSRVIKPLERPGCYVVDHPRMQDCSPDTPMGDIPVDAVWDKVVAALAGT
jgi:heptosyltransferase-3